MYILLRNYRLIINYTCNDICNLFSVQLTTWYASATPGINGKTKNMKDLLNC